MLLIVWKLSLYSHKKIKIAVFKYCPYQQKPQLIDRKLKFYVSMWLFIHYILVTIHKIILIFWIEFLSNLSTFRIEFMIFRWNVAKLTPYNFCELLVSLPCLSRTIITKLNSLTSIWQRSYYKFEPVRVLIDISESPTDTWEESRSALSLVQLVAADPFGLITFNYFQWMRMD